MFEGLKDWIERVRSKRVSSDCDIVCPVCGYYCNGKGGHGCIDKPSLVFDTRRKNTETEDAK